MDEKKGRLTAKEQDLIVMGVLGVLELANRQQKIDLPQAIEKLLRTNIKISPSRILQNSENLVFYLFKILFE